MPSSPLAKKNSSGRSSRSTQKDRQSTTRQSSSKSSSAKAKSGKTSTSKALVPVAEQQAGLSSRERLAKKRQANAATSPAKKSRKGGAKRAPAKRKRRATHVKQAPLPLVERPWFAPMVRTLHEGALLVTSALIIYLLISLGTYHAADPGFSQVGLTDKVQNLGGRGGAWVADLLYSLLGHCAFWVPLFLSYVVFLLFKLGRQGFSWPLCLLRVSGFTVLLLSATPLATLYLAPQDLPMSSGGILGSEMVRVAGQIFSPLATSLLVLTGCLVGISMIIDLSWSGLVGWVGRVAIKSTNGLLLWLKATSDHWAEKERVFEEYAEEERDRQAALLQRDESGDRKGRHQQGAQESEKESKKRLKRGLSNEGDADSTDSFADGLSGILKDHSSVSDKLQSGIEKLKNTRIHFVENLKMRQKLAKQRQGLALSDRTEPTVSGVDGDDVLADPLMGGGSDERAEDRTNRQGIKGVKGFNAISGPVDGSPENSPIGTSTSTSMTTVGRDSAIDSQGYADDDMDDLDRYDVDAYNPDSESSLPSSDPAQTKTPITIEQRADVNASKPSSSRRKPKRKSLFGREVVGELPPIELLDPADHSNSQGFTEEELENLSRLLELKLRDFNIEAEVEAVIPGPVVTRFEIQPAPGIKVMRITNLAKDLARSMAVISVRVVEVIPGKTTVGIEIPNSHREVIRLSEVIASDAYEGSKSSLTLCLGKDISGHSVTADLAKMPHLLVAGTTGSGKSVGLNAMLISMLFKATPDQLRLIMIDPKMLELSVYDDIPHLLSPVVTDMKEAANALRWCVAEMERRYRLMAAMGVRNLAGFNRKVKEAIKAEAPLTDPLWKPTDLNEPAPKLEPLPNIVVVIDEFADMMMIVGKKVEELIARIAQKARAAGIHLILATQRPSVDVITGLIKANVPSRIAFQVSSKVDSRTILDQGGAEQLLGSGDMLYLPPGTALPQRVHGAFVSDDEVHRVCDDWRERGDPDYLDEILDGHHESGAAPGFEAEKSSDDPEADPLYDEAVKFVTQTRKASISSVQRKLKIGYNRAARMIDSMEAAGVVSPMQNNGSREVIAPPPV